MKLIANIFGPLLLFAAWVLNGILNETPPEERPDALALRQAAESSAALTVTDELLSRKSPSGQCLVALASEDRSKWVWILLNPEEHSQSLRTTPDSARFVLEERHLAELLRFAARNQCGLPALWSDLLERAVAAPPSGAALSPQ